MLSGPKPLQAGGRWRVVTPSLAMMGTMLSRRFQCLLSPGTYHSNPWSIVWFTGGLETMEEGLAEGAGVMSVGGELWEQPGEAILE